MKEIKFSCPHCRQHIACDADYGDLCIVCPTCGQPMEVPRLSAADASHPDLCVVASIPTPKQRLASRVPTIDLWTEDEWEERYRAASTPAEPTPAWLVAALGTLIAAALLKATLAPAWLLILGVVAGTALSGYLLVKHRTISALAGAHSEADQILSGVAQIGMLLLALPAVILGILFVGCAVCG